jgi:hypothetical protein
MSSESAARLDHLESMKSWVFEALVEANSTAPAMVREPERSSFARQTAARQTSAKQTAGSALGNRDKQDCAIF